MIQAFGGLVFILVSFSVNGAACPSSPAIKASECLSADIIKAEKSLNIAYKHLQTIAGTINDPGSEGEAVARALLAKAHKSWLNYRLSQCAFEAYQQGGVVNYKAVYNYQCLLEMSNQRIKLYEQFTKQQY